MDVAIKILFKKLIRKDKYINQLQRKVQIQASLSHPNILSLYGYFSDMDHVFIVLEFAPKGALSIELRACGKFTEKRSASYIKQLADALSYCHSNEVIHRFCVPMCRLHPPKCVFVGRLRHGEVMNAVPIQRPRPTKTSFVGRLRHGEDRPNSRSLKEGCIPRLIASPRRDERWRN